MPEHLSTYTHDMTDRVEWMDQLLTHQYWYAIQSHMLRIGEIIIETNDHNRYVREILHKHIMPWWYYRIYDISDRTVVHHAYAMCSIARDTYNMLAETIMPLKVNITPDMSLLIDAQRDMLQSVIELLEKDIKTALHHMK